MYAVILAGGAGERFWPLSTKARPKQFLDLERSGRSLLQSTFDRLVPLAGDASNIFVVTASRYSDLIGKQLPELDDSNLIVEPVPRDTAPAVALAALELQRRCGNVLMGLFPSDHRVADVEAFATTIRRAAWFASAKRNIVTIGVKPTYAATGYGYIHIGAGAEGGAYQVARFVEKPDLQRASEYLAEGNYYWNSGMFLWHSGTILAELERFMPELIKPLAHAHQRGDIEGAFAELPKISIDYAVLERTDRTSMIPGDFGWDDLGSWLALERLYRGDKANTVFGRHEGLNSHGNIVYAYDEGLIVTLGVRDLVVVRRGDKVLVAHKSHAEAIKQLGPKLADDDPTSDS